MATSPRITLTKSMRPLLSNCFNISRPAFWSSPSGSSSSIDIRSPIMNSFPTRSLIASRTIFENRSRFSSFPPYSSSRVFVIGE